MTPHCTEIRSKLCIYERDYLQYTKCLCREIELVVSGEPEELVRQVLLYFLLRESGLFPDSIEIRAEHRNLDVAIYKFQSAEEFRPLQPPLVIVEVKREEANLLEHEGQLFEYMKEHRTRTGVLFNGNEIVAYEKGQDTPAKCSLDSLNELRDLVQCQATRDEVDFCAFQRAQDGDIDSFIYLACKYGKYTLHQFTFTLKNSLTPVSGCCFRLHDQLVYYDVYGKYAPKKSFYFSRSDFGRLLSLIY